MNRHPFLSFVVTYVAISLVLATVSPSKDEDPLFPRILVVGVITGFLVFVLPRVLVGTKTKTPAGGEDRSNP